MSSLYKGLADMLAEAHDREANLSTRIESLQLDLDSCRKEVAALELVISKVIKNEAVNDVNSYRTNALYEKPAPNPTNSVLPDISEAIMMAVREHQACGVSKISEVLGILGFPNGGQQISSRLTSLVRNGYLISTDDEVTGRKTYTVKKEQS